MEERNDGRENREMLVPRRPRLVRFGTFEFDLDAGTLHQQGRKVLLQDQPARLLALFVSTPGAIVSRDDLRHALWADDTFVAFDDGLNVAIGKLRQALGDSASSPRFIETMPRRGYRFLADVHEVGAPAAGAITPAPAFVPATPPGDASELRDRRRSDIPDRRASGRSTPMWRAVVASLLAVLLAIVALVLTAWWWAVQPRG